MNTEQQDKPLTRLGAFTTSQAAYALAPFSVDKQMLVLGWAESHAGLCLLLATRAEPSSKSAPHVARTSVPIRQ